LVVAVDLLERAQRRLDPGRLECRKTASSTTRSIRRPPTDWQRSVPYSWLPRTHA
jgi:hypothetical protein